MEDTAMLINANEHRDLHLMPISNQALAACQPFIELTDADVLPLAQQGIPIVLPIGAEALPQALLTPDTTDDILAGYMPSLWRDYPFTLVESTLGITSEGEATTHPVLWADPQAPHWTPDQGYRLFDLKGQPTPYLTKVMQRLQAQQKAIARTRERIALLHRAKVLSPACVTHQNQTLAVWRVEGDGLQERLEALDSDLSLSTFLFADALLMAPPSFHFHPAGTFALEGYL
jgi:hypothetical protein